MRARTVLLGLVLASGCQVNSRVTPAPAKDAADAGTAGEVVDCSAGCPWGTHPPGRETLYAFLDRGSLEEANLILEDTWPVPRFEPVKLPSSLTWTEDPYGERYWRFVFYGLRPTTHLLWAFRETGDRRYRDKLLQVLTTFHANARQSPFYGDDNHAVAFRAMVLVNVHWKLKMAAALSASEEAMVQELIRDAGLFLEDPLHFDSGYNHGFAEAATLLLIAENFPEWDVSPRWKALAWERLDHLMQVAVGEDGAATENSVYYHFYILTQLAQVSTWTERYGLERSARLSAAIPAMIRFGTHIIQPNGKIPMMGASLERQMRSYEKEVYRGLAEKDPALAYVLSAGKKGSPPEETFVRFPSAGVAVMRSSFGPTPADRQSLAPFAQQTHVVFDYGPYRTDHSDLDALSVHLYSAGRTLLTDSGLFTYEYTTPEFAYFHGTRAHNTVVVDGKDQEMGTGTPHHTAQGKGWAYQSASHTLYPGVRHWRAVALLARDLVLVVDELRSDSTHHYEQRWHFEPDISLRKHANRVAAYDQTGTPVLAVYQHRNDLELSAVRGATAPVDGWYSVNYEVMEPASVLRYGRPGSMERFVTLFAAGPLASTAGGVSVREGRGGLEIFACAGGRGHTLWLSNPGQPGEAVSVVSREMVCPR